MLGRFSSGIMLALLLMAVPSIQTTLANPVPYPRIAMPKEYIYANITVSSEGAYAKVNGTYPFVNYGYNNISMSYPLPQNSTNVSVQISGNTTPWWYSDADYSTIFGELPVINWTIDPAPHTFSVEVDYEHTVPLIDQNFVYFYAMGTWKNMGEIYAKQTTAYVTADINTESIDESEIIEVYAYQILYNFTTQEWVWKPLDCSISRIDKKTQVNVEVISNPFSPIEGDFVLTFKTITLPGFPSFLVLQLFILSTLLVVIVLKSRLKSKGFRKHQLLALRIFKVVFTSSLVYQIRRKVD
jgi:hypothetical protein